MKEVEKIQDLIKSNDPNHIYDALIDIGKKHLYDFEETVNKLLDHDEPEVRRAAIMVLSTYWGRKDFISKSEEIWNNDPDDLVRVTAFISWFSYYAKSNDKKITDQLHQLLTKKELDFDMRKEAFRGIYVVNDKKVPEKIIDNLDFVYSEKEFNDCINWEEVEDLIKESI